jgi:hypothetical protein
VGPTVTDDQWTAVRHALAETGDRFAKMICAVDPRAKATMDWTVAETAAHVTAIGWLYTAMIRPDTPALPMPGIQDQWLATNVDTVGDLNDACLREFPERDPHAVADLLRSSIDDILRTSDGLDRVTPVTWLGNAQVPLAGVLAHLLNELQIHGRDIATATGSPWVIPPREAALFFDLFLVGMLHYDVGVLMDTGVRPPDRRIAVEFHSAHTAPVTFVLHQGRVKLEEVGGNTDVRLSFDPITLNLVLFHRMSRIRAALTGKIVVRGRRPWLLPAFLRTVRLPDRAPS